MKNLYARLKVPPSASADTIRAALTNASPRDRQDAEGVLLLPGRRALYDRTYRQLSQLSLYRSTLGLHRSAYTCHPMYEDFAPAPATAPPPPPPPRQSASSHSSPWDTGPSQPAPDYNDALYVEQRKRRQQVGGLFATLLPLVLFGGAFLYNELSPSPATSASVAPRPAAVPPDTSPPRAKVPAPAAKAPQPQWSQITDNSRATPAPLRLTPPESCSASFTSGAGNRSHFIEVKTNPRGGMTLVRMYVNGAPEWYGQVFIHAGDTCRLNLPRGVFKMKTASGQNWYGYESLFGARSTYYSESSDLFDLTEPGSYYTVELIEQVGGNMDTHSISAAQF